MRSRETSSAASARSFSSPRLILVFFYKSDEGIQILFQASTPSGELCQNVCWGHNRLLAGSGEIHVVVSNHYKTVYLTGCAIYCCDSQFN